LTPDFVPADLRYHPEHDWARLDGAEATLGITWFAQEEIGELVWVDLPAVGATIAKDLPYAEVESVKAVSDVVAPLSGEVVAVNDGVLVDPALVNREPYAGGWLVRICVTHPEEQAHLLDAAAYRDLIDNG
jgi:glycine cleavage system H protein